MLTELPITELKTTSANPRKVRTTKEQDDQLANSIKRLGLINPITVKKNGKGYDVIAGSRRFKAAKVAGLITVPVTVIEEDAAQAVALEENTHRVDMHPADEMVAFKACVASGRSTKEIANDFGVTEIRVARRLALGSLIPAAIKLWRNDEIDISAARALCIGTPEQQKDVCESNMRSAWQIRDFVTAGGLYNNSRLGKFAGKEYEKAGEALTRDLFEDRVIYHDIERLTSIAEQKIGLIAKKKYPNAEIRKQLSGLEIPKGFVRAEDADIVLAALDFNGDPVLVPVKPNESLQGLEGEEEKPQAISAAHMRDFEKVRRGAWVLAVKDGKIDCEKLVKAMIKRALGHTPLYGSELSRPYNANQGIDAPDYSMPLLELLAAYFFDINQAGDTHVKGFNLRDYWTPNREFFSRMKAGQIQSVIVEVTGEDPLTTKNPVLKRERMNKKEWAQMAADIFEGEYDKALQDTTRIGTWQP